MRSISESSGLTTSFITPLLKQRGFKKYASFERSPTHDSAAYRRGDLEVHLVYASHPYDYPGIGIRVQIRNAGGILFDRPCPPADGGTVTIPRAVANDSEGAAAVCQLT